MYRYVGECKNCWCAGTETRVSSKLSPHSHTRMLIVYFSSPKAPEKHSSFFNF